MNRIQPHPFELCGESVRDLRGGKAPAYIMNRLRVAPGSTLRLDAAGDVPIVHSIEPIAQAAKRHGDLDDVRVIPLDRFGAAAPFIAGQKGVTCVLKRDRPHGKGPALFGKKNERRIDPQRAIRFGYTVIIGSNLF